MLIIVSFVFFVNQVLFSQEPEYANGKNSIKGMPTLLLPGVFTGISMSLGYERMINQKYSIDISLFGLWYYDPGDYYQNAVGVYPSWKYYFTNKKQYRTLFWISPYLSYIQSYDENVWGETFYMFGLGAAVGSKVLLFKRRNWFIDIGFGMSVNYEKAVNTYLCEEGRYYPKYIPRPIFVFGKIF